VTDLPPQPMPDPQTFLLPARAYLLSMRDQNLPLRRTALDDAEAHYREAPQGTDHEKQITRIALVALVGEALQILEDLAAFGDSFTSAPEGTAFFAALTNYSPHRINNFYAQMRKRPLDYYLDLLGLRRGALRLEDAFNLAEEWRKYRPFSNAYKHGLLVANPEDVTLVDDSGAEIEGIVVWMRKRASAEGYGHIAPPYDRMADFLAAAGRTALDVLEHLVDSRLRIFDSIELRADGTLTVKPLETLPWRWWFDKKDVSDHSLELLSARFNMTFE